MGRISIRSAEKSGFPDEFHEIIEYGILSSQTNPFDPMERALTNMGDAYLLDTEHIHTDWQMVKEYSLSKELLAMSRVFIHPESHRQTIATKGAPEAIFELCHLPEEDQNKYSAAVAEMASAGLRVLGVAKSFIGRKFCLKYNTILISNLLV